MEVKPIRGNILVRLAAGETKSPGGLIMVQTEKPPEGEVMAVGDGVLTLDGTAVPLIVKVGDKVFFKRGSGYEIKLGDQPHLIMSETDVLAVVT